MLYIFLLRFQGNRSCCNVHQVNSFDCTVSDVLKSASSEYAAEFFNGLVAPEGNYATERATTKFFRGIQ